MEDLLNVVYNYILTKGLPFCILNPKTILHYQLIIKKNIKIEIKFEQKFDFFRKKCYN